MVHLCSAVVLVGLLALLAARLREPATLPLMGSALALLAWTLGYMAELAAPDLGVKLVWADLQFVAATLFPMAWLIAVRHVIGAPPLPPRLMAALWAFAGMLIALIHLNPFQAFRNGPRIDVQGGIAFVDAAYGPLYFGVWLPFTLLLLISTVVLLLQAAVFGPPFTRERNLLLLIATVLPMLAGMVYIIGILPWPDYDPIVAVLSVSGAISGVALVRHRLVDLTPLARDIVIEQLADGVVVTDRSGRLVDLNPAATAILPDLGPHSLGRPLHEALRDQQEFLAACKAGRTGDEAVYTRHADGCDAVPLPEAHPAQSYDFESIAAWPGCSTQYFSVRVTPIVNPGQVLLGEIIVLHDISRRLEAYRQVRRLATTDELTGLLSRRQLLELGEREMERSARLDQPLSALLIDIDDFKLVNDHQGHAAGDVVLREVAQTCLAQLRSFDLLGRYGGDEICALLPNLDEEQALAVAERLRSAVALSMMWHEETLIQVTLSIGVASWPDCSHGSLRELISRADDGLYRAKSMGRNKVATAAYRTVTSVGTS